MVGTYSSIKYTKMEARSNSQLLVSLMLLGVFCSQTLALPLETYSTMRLGNGILFDGPNEPDQNLGLLNIENDHLESSLPENYLSFLDVPRALNRNSRHVKGMYTSDVSKYLEELAARQFIKYLIQKRDGKIRMQEKRHSDSVFTDSYSQFLRKEALKKYLEKVLNGKRSEEDNPNLEP
ncbi:myc target protein 1 isoform X3 [Petaurus breviceps papuanus]|uniref:myc target protein 1 isoform X3 n=1 Tax=Petaurus breviceps papuanus TaxID=3040969 RepID=UPI0036D7B8B7